MKYLLFLTLILANIELDAQIFGKVNAPQIGANTIHVNGDTCLMVSPPYSKDVSFYSGNLFWIDENRKPFGDTLTIQGLISGTCKDGDGGYVIVGDFVYDDGNIRKEGVLHVTKHGEVDPGFQDFSRTKPYRGFEPDEIFMADSNLYFIRGASDNSQFIRVNDLKTNILVFRDSTMTPFKMPLANGDIMTGVLDSSGLIIAGNFTSIGGVGRHAIARIRNNGTLDLDFDTRIDGTVSEILKIGNKLLIAGEIHSINDTLVHNFGILDLQTGEVTPVLTGIDGKINSILVKDSIIYMGGGFKKVNGSNSIGYAGVEMGSGKLVLRGNLDGGHETVYDLDVLGDTLFIGGNFDKVTSLSLKGLAAVSRKTGAAFTWDAKANHSVFGVQVYGKHLYVHGQFTSIGGRSNIRTAEIDLKTATATKFKHTGFRRIGNLVYGGGVFDVKTSRLVSKHDYTHYNNTSTRRASNYFVSEDAFFVTNANHFLGANLKTNRLWALTPGGNVITKQDQAEDSVEVERPYIFEANGHTYISNITPRMNHPMVHTTVRLSTDGKVFKFIPDSFSTQVFDPRGKTGVDQFYKVVGDDKDYVYTFNQYFNKNTLQWEFPDTTLGIFSWDNSHRSYNKIRAVREGNKLVYYGEVLSYKVSKPWNVSKRSRYVNNYLVRDFQSGGILGNMGTTTDLGKRERHIPHFVGSKLLFTKETTSGFSSGVLEWKGTQGLQSYSPFREVRPTEQGYPIPSPPPLLISASGRAVVHGFVSQPHPSIYGNQKTFFAFNWKTGKEISIDIPDTFEIRQSISNGRYIAFTEGVWRTKIYLYDRFNDKLESWTVDVKGSVEDFKLTEDKIFVGGDFSEVQGDARSNLAAIDLFSNSTVAWAPSINKKVDRVLVHDDELIIRGQFTTINGVSINNLASVDTTSGKASRLPGINFTTAPTLVNDDTLMFTLGGVRNAYYDLSTRREIKWFDHTRYFIRDAVNFGGKSYFRSHTEGLGTEGMKNVLTPLPFHGVYPTNWFTYDESSSSGDLMLLSNPKFLNGEGRFRSVIFGLCRPKLVSLEQADTLCSSVEQIRVEVEFENGLPSENLPLYVSISGKRTDQVCKVLKRNGKYWVNIVLESPIQTNSIETEVAIRNERVSAFMVHKKDTLRKTFIIDRAGQSRAKLVGPNVTCSQSEILYRAKNAKNAAWQVENGNYTAINDSTIRVNWYSNKSFGRVYLTDAVGSCSQKYEQNVSIIKKRPIGLDVSDTTVCSDVKLKVTLLESPFGNVSWRTETGVLSRLSASEMLASSGNDTSVTFFAVDSLPGVQGCKVVSDTVSIVKFPEMRLTIGGQNQVCENDKEVYHLLHVNDTVQGNGTWKVSHNHQFTHTGKGIEVSWTANGNIHYFGLDSNGCSTHSDTILVDVNPLPAIGLPFKSVDICQGTEAKVIPNKSNSAVSVQWYLNNPTAPVAISDTLKLDSLPLGSNKVWAVPVDTQHGCKPLNIDTISYKVDTIPNLVLPNDSFICEGNPISITAITTGKTPRWLKDGNLIASSKTLTVKPETIGTHSYKFETSSITGTCHASNDWEVEVIEIPESGIKAVELSELEYKFEASKPAVGVNYTWFIDNKRVGSGQTISHEFKAEGNYYVKLLADRKGCVSSDSLAVEIDTATIGIEQVTIQKCEPVVFPNPSYGWLKIVQQNQCSNLDHFSLLNMQGKEMSIVVTQESSTVYGLQLSCPPGLYLLKYQDGDSWYVTKIRVGRL